MTQKEQSKQSVGAKRYVEVMDPDVYHSQPEISKSGLDMIAKAPRLYHWHHIDPDGEPLKQTPAMELGEYVHVATLEPDRWQSRYICAPKFDRRTKAGKEQAAQFELENEGKIVVPSDMYDHANRSADAVREHPHAGDLLMLPGRAEVSMFSEHEETGVGIRGRADYILDGSSSIIDLKTTRDASARKFYYSVRDYRYDVQAAFYLDLLSHFREEVGTFYWVAVEPRPPYMVSLYWAGQDMVNAGREKYYRDLLSYKVCLETNTWPGYVASQELNLEVPK